MLTKASLTAILASKVPNATLVPPARPPDLAPCPFCGDGGEYQEHVSRLGVTMRGPGAIISVALRHWCTRVPGCVSSFREVRGRDRATAVLQWNQRAATTPSNIWLEGGVVAEAARGQD